VFNQKDKENKVKPIVRQFDNKAAFTIIELMTVMSVIIILLGLLVPGLNALRRYAKDVAQKNQFYAIGTALDTFSAEWDDYPSSEPAAVGVDPYCGATQLARAMVGKDLLGYDPTGTYTDPNSSARRLYLPIDRANAYRLKDLYQALAAPGAWPIGNQYVLCDVYANVDHLRTGKLVGMPVLYYKANAASSTNIYDFEDNSPLVAFGLPWQQGDPHPFDAAKFAEQIRNDEIWESQSFYRPNNADSYILLSAGSDGKYGTDDDMFNFRK